MNSRRLQNVPEKLHPDHKAQLSRINKISGQLEAIKKMIVKREYCPKIIQQFKAIRGALKAAEMDVLDQHLHNCVREAMVAKSQHEIDRKISEVIEYVRKVVT